MARKKSSSADVQELLDAARRHHRQLCAPRNLLSLGGDRDAAEARFLQAQRRRSAVKDQKADEEYLLAKETLATAQRFFDNWLANCDRDLKKVRQLERRLENTIRREENEKREELRRMRREQELADREEEEQERAKERGSATAQIDIRFRRQVRRWYKKTRPLFSDYAAIIDFPEPPSMPCYKAECNAGAPSRNLQACPCIIRAAFASLKLDDYEVLKESSLWQSERFAVCAAERREEFQKKAEEMSAVLEDLL